MTSHLIRSMKGKAIVDIQRGRKVGALDDLLIQPDQLAIKALLVSGGVVFSRRTDIIDVGDVRLWGEDVILVEHPDVIRHDSEMITQRNWVKCGDLRGRYVVSLDGKRVGQVDDLLIDPHGKIEGLRLSQVYIEGPVGRVKTLSSGAIRSLGPDVVIIALDEADRAAAAAAQNEDTLVSENDGYIEGRPGSAQIFDDRPR